MNTAQVKELVLQALTHEKGGILVYETALECVQNEELREEWQEYLEQTRTHVETLTGVCKVLGLDPGEVTPGCAVVQHLGKSLVAAMKMALSAGDPAAAELVACDCVVLAETKDHANWQLLGKVAQGMKGEGAKALRDAHSQVEDQEDEHLYHSTGWGRELHLKALGMKARLPPPEEVKDVKTAIGAARAAKASEAH